MCLEIVKTYADTDVVDALKMIADVCGEVVPKNRHDSATRPKGKATENDIYELLIDLDKKAKLPDIVVPCAQLKFCPIETVSDSDPGILVRMERLEKVVREAISLRPAATVSRPPAVTGTSAALQAKTLSGFGPALERARSVSCGREQDVQQQAVRVGSE